MRRRALLATFGTGIAAAAAGCFGDEPDGLPAASSNPDQDREIDGAPLRVSGSGSVSTEPNQARFRAAIEETGDDAEAVGENLAARVDEVQAALLDAGLEDGAIETSRYRLREQRQGTGYEATHSLLVEVDDVDRVGELIDVAIEAGADGVGRINFSIDDETRAEHREVALERAIDDARAEAEVVAEAKGMEITGVAEVEVESSGVSPFEVRYAVAEADDGGSGGTDIDGGDVDVSASVTVTYIIE